MRLAELTTLRVGGSARDLVTAGTRDEIIDALRVAPDLFVLGDGSNIVVSERGLDTTVLHLDGGDIVATPVLGGDAYDFVIDAGVAWDAFVAETVRLGCTGVELLSGIPGRAGAAPIQNINAYGQQMRSTVRAVEVVERSTLEVREIPEAECGFGFRQSHFKGKWAGRYVVTRLRCRLATQLAEPPMVSTYADVVRHFESGGSPTDVVHRRAAVLQVRGAKSMLADTSDPNVRSAGSFFINPRVPAALADELEARFDAIGLRVNYPDNATPAGERRIPAAHVLRASGFNRGDSWGPVALSEKHVLALVTRPGATADDVWLVANFLRDRAENETGVRLEFEPQFIGDFPVYNRARVESEYHYEPAPDGEPDWMRSLR